MLPLIDDFQRVHHSLRVGVTDRCNIRCFYCMPNENIQFLEHKEILRFEEITRIVKALVPSGIRKIRVTGGEPLVRRELWKLIEQLSNIEELTDIALTTNGILLEQQAQALFDAGLHRLNVSLDTVNEESFLKIARRKGLDRVLAGIAKAQEVGFENIRINAVSIAGLTEQEVVPLAEFARSQNLELRFIEFMPLDAEQGWNDDQVLTGNQVREIIENSVGTLTAVPRPDPAQPATDFIYTDGSGKVGFINPVSAPFCSSCDRLRLTSEGKFRNCLFSIEEWDVKQIVRNGGDDEAIREIANDCVTAKKAGHGIDSGEFERPSKSMYQIGG